MVIVSRYSLFSCGYRLLLQQEEGSSLGTVGVLCLDSRGSLCAGVSSGGIALKSAGRVGQVQ